MSDGEYVEARAALERFLAGHRPRLLGVAWRILRDEDQAEDVVQETLAAVLRRLAVDPPRHLAAYVHKAVERNALKALARRRTAVSFDETVHAVGAEENDDADEAGIDLVTLEQALMQLPPAQQTVIRMRYYAGYTFRQIGEALAISMNTAASRCRYALAALRERLSRRA